MPDVTILGAGYVGLCTGAVLAHHGHRVTLVDVDPDRVAMIERGESPIYEPGLEALLTKLVEKGKLSATTDVQDALPGSDVTFLCVGTPQSADGTADLTYVRQAAEDVGQHLGDAQAGHVVVVKSTVPPGTTRDVVTPILEKASHLTAGDGFGVAMNPEFLREGSALDDALHPDRIVLGAGDADAAERVWQLYEPYDCPKLTVTPTTAEMIKYASNAFLAARVGLSNELANVCERVGVDWNDVAHGIGLDERIGPHFLRAGAGFGGSCFPKDVAAIARVAHDKGRPSGILDAVLEGNERQPRVAVDMLREALGEEVEGKRVALLGLAFKPGTDDVRETRALPIHQALEAAGARVVCHDPQAGENFRELAPRAELVQTPEEALDGAHGCIVQTAWPAYAEIEPGTFLERMAEPVVVDARRALDAHALLEAGVRLRAIGLGQP